MLRHLGAGPPGDAAPGLPEGIRVNDARVALSLRAYLPARGLSPDDCRATVGGTDAEGLVVVDVTCEGRSLSLRLRSGSYEVVRAVETGTLVR